MSKAKDVKKDLDDSKPDLFHTMGKFPGLWLAIVIMAFGVTAGIILTNSISYGSTAPAPEEVVQAVVVPSLDTEVPDIEPIKPADIKVLKESAPDLNILAAPPLKMMLYAEEDEALEPPEFDCLYLAGNITDEVARTGMALGCEVVMFKILGDQVFHYSETTTLMSDQTDIHF